MTQQSKLSEALAATLLRFKEIDRDTIEALCKRAATLAHQTAVNQGAPEQALAINKDLRETLRARNDEIYQLSESVNVWKTAEQELSSAYIKLREILGSLTVREDYGSEPDAVWRFTEEKARNLVKSHNQLQWALRELLAQTRDLHDAGPEGESYQSDTLENAIAVADALVGEKATEQYPIADEPLNRRIQELELQLAAVNVKDGAGVSRVHIPSFDHIATGEYRPVKDVVAEGDRRFMWSENALRKLMKDVLADRETELATSFQESQVSMDNLLAATFKQAQDEMQPGGRIHKALIGNSPIAQPATPVCPHGMGLACAGLNTLVHVSPTVKGDEAMARKVRDIIFEEMKHGGVIHSAFYRK